MTSLADRFAADITLEYSLIDRMRVRGHVMKLQNVGMLGAFFERFRGVPWIEPEDVAPVVVFLASNAARMVSGATFDVTAGDSAHNTA